MVFVRALFLFLLLFLLLLCAPSHSASSASTESSITLEEIAKIEAEIQVRDYHLVRTPENDRKKTLTKIQDLEANKNKLYRQLYSSQITRIKQQHNSQINSLEESFSFLDTLVRECQQNEDYEECRMIGIRSALEKVIIAFSGKSSLQNKLPSKIKDSARIALSESQIISYNSIYDVSLSNDGYVTWNISVEGELIKSLTKVEILSLETKITKEIKKADQQQIEQLIAGYRKRLMNDDSLIEKSDKKKHVIGSF